MTDQARRLRITGPQRAPAPASLVLGHDSRPGSDTALRVAADLAGRLRADLHVVHGVDLSDYPVDADAADWEERFRSTLAAECARVEQALTEAPAGWTFHAARGDPVALLDAVAEETHALMIIVGSRGEGALATAERVLGGSVSRGVLRRQHRPVLIVPSDVTSS